MTSSHRARAATRAQAKAWLKRSGRAYRSMRRRLAAPRIDPRHGSTEGGILVAQLEPADLLTDDYARQARWKKRLDTEPHEPEFRVFRHLDGPDEVFVDVGAHIGDSVISFRLLNALARIISFEPNPMLEPALAALASQDDRFSFHMLGLGDERASRALYVPCLGRRPSLPLASMNADRFVGVVQVAAMLGLMGADPGQRLGVSRLDVKVVPLDDLGLDPTVLKIDAETWEVHVLAGATETIRRSRPLLLVEGGTRDPLVAAMLSDLEYSPCELVGDQLRPADRVDAENGFFAARERLNEYQRRGLVAD